MSKKLERFEMRVSQDFLHLVDDWRRQQPDIPSRAEAIRRLVSQGFLGDFEKVRTFVEGTQRWLELSRATDTPVSRTEAKAVSEAMMWFVQAMKTRLDAEVAMTGGVPEIFAILEDIQKEDPPSDT